MVMLEFFWEIFQTKYIYDTKTDMRTRAREVESKTLDTKRDIRELEEKIDKLSLVCRALWTYVQENHSLSEEDLMEKIKEVDLMDGTADGKLTNRNVLKCKSCKRVVNKRHNKCIYCGSEGKFESIFETL